MIKNGKYGIPSVDLGIFPTPLCRLDAISKFYGDAANFYIKRDDMTGLALGGNKTRKLKYVLADAISKGCDTIITAGGAQSNHCAITAAACNKLGIGAELVLTNEGVTDLKGNQVLYMLFGAKVHLVDAGDISKLTPFQEELKAKLEKEGKKPYIVPVGASVPLGALGYVDSMEEIAKEAEEKGIKIDRVVVTLGSGGTYAGTLLGTGYHMPYARVTGIDISGMDAFRDKIAPLVLETQKFLSGSPVFKDEKAVLDHMEIYSYEGDGYAIPSETGDSAIRKMAELEGIIFDPVYTGKTFGGMLDLYEKGVISKNENIVFLHTGGAASLFAFY